MFQAIITIGVVGLVLGGLIGIANRYLEVKEEPIVKAIYDLLPHFNCGACGTPGCMANAKEIAFNNQPLTSCVPGNAQMRKTIQKVLDDYKSGDLTFDDK